MRFARRRSKIRNYGVVPIRAPITAPKIVRYLARKGRVPAHPVSGTRHNTWPIVKQHVSTLKTEASEKPIPLSPSLIRDLLLWREETPYARDRNYVFASPMKQGKQPYWMSAMMRDHIQPVAARLIPGKRVTWQAHDAADLRIVAAGAQR